MAPFNRSYTTYCWSAIIIIALSCVISEIKQDIGRKSRFLYPLGQFPAEDCHTVWCGKTRMVWLPVGEKVLLHV